MKRHFVFQMFIASVFGIPWSCGDADLEESRSTGDTEVATDSASDTSEDTSTAPGGNTDPDTILGTEAPTISYEGFEDLYIMTADDDPVDVCRVRYPLRAVARPAVPCAICEWAVVVEKGNPEVMVDRHDACANSDLGLDDAAIAAGVGDRIAYGYADESVGHASILMRYNPANGRWEEYTVSNWDQASEFRYKRRDGMCAYAGEDETEPSTSGICGISGEATIGQPGDLTDE